MRELWCRILPFALSSAEPRVRTAASTPRSPRSSGRSRKEHEPEVLGVYAVEAADPAEIGEGKDGNTPRLRQGDLGASGISFDSRVPAAIQGALYDDFIRTGHVGSDELARHLRL